MLHSSDFYLEYLINNSISEILDGHFNIYNILCEQVTDYTLKIIFVVSVNNGLIVDHI